MILLLCINLVKVLFRPDIAGLRHDVVSGFGVTVSVKCKLLHSIGSKMYLVKASVSYRYREKNCGIYAAV